MWGLLGKLVLLGAARRWAKRPTAAVETAALVLVLNERRLGRGPKRDLLLRAAHVLLLPAAVIKSVRFVRALAGGKRRGPNGGGPPLELPSPSLEPLPPGAAVAADPLTAAATPLPSFRHQPPPLPRSVPRAEWGLLQIPEVAPEYAAWVQCLRNVLAQQGLRSLPPGVDPDGLELTRYLLYGGLLAATKPHEAARAVAATAARVTGTMEWRATYPFMSEDELKEWEDVTWWAGPDQDGTLWLHMHMTRAMARCVRGEGRRCVQAIISQLEYGTRVHMASGPAAAAASIASTSTSASSAASVADGGGDGDDGAAAAAAAVAAAAVTGGRGRGLLSGSGGRGRRGGGGVGSTAPGGSALGRMDDRIRVVVVGTGSNVRQVLRMSPLFREFARLVQRHYPGRLRAMYLVDMPRGLRMGLGAVLNLLSQETRQKVKVCKIEDLPDCISGALLAREAAQQQRHHQHQPAAAAALADGEDYEADGGTDAAAAASHLLAALAAAAASVVPGPLRRPPPAGLLTATREQLRELRLWLLRVLPAVLMAAMACLTYKSLLARP